MTRGSRLFLYTSPPLSPSHVLSGLVFSSFRVLNTKCSESIFSPTILPPLSLFLSVQKDQDDDEVLIVMHLECKTRLLVKAVLAKS